MRSAVRAARRRQPRAPEPGARRRPAGPLRGGREDRQPGAVARAGGGQRRLSARACWRSRTPGASSRTKTSRKPQTEFFALTRMHKSAGRSTGLFASRACSRGLRRLSPAWSSRPSPKMPPRWPTWIPAGPRMTANSTGRKNRIIGTVSFGGRAAAFFSASFMRLSRLSWRARAAPGRPACRNARPGSAPGSPTSPIRARCGVPRFSRPACAPGRKESSALVSTSSSASADRLRADLVGHAAHRGLDRDAGFDADQHQVERIRPGAAGSTAGAWTARLVT